MTKEEFLLKGTGDLIFNFYTNTSVPPTFTLLFNDGSTQSIGLFFERKNYKLFMQKLCENPKVIASIFTCEGWSSSSADETKFPVEYDNTEKVSMLLYSTRNNVHKSHIYKSTKNGDLELILVSNSFNEILGNPFNSILNMTPDERLKAIMKFEKTILDSVSHAFEKYRKISPMMYCLTNTPEEVSLFRLPKREWLDKIILKRRICSKCRKPETLAFMLEFPVEQDMVTVILVSSEIQEVYNFKINSKLQTLDFVNKGTYDGEFSDLLKN